VAGDVVRAHLVDLIRTVGAKLAQWDAADAAEPAADSDRSSAIPSKSDWLRDWLPFAIVAVSVGAAAMGWQASVADERATNKDEVSRQDLVRLQQLRLEKVQAVDAEIRMFGSLEQHLLLAKELRRDAMRAGGSERHRLASEERVEQAAARSLAAQLTFFDRERVLKGEPYNAQVARVTAESSDVDMASLEPTPLRLAARSQRTMGLRLTGLAVLFVMGLVFFTLAAVNQSRRAQMFAGLGATAAVSALALFPIVRFL
jgi:hypothetical protein